MMSSCLNSGADIQELPEHNDNEDIIISSPNIESPEWFHEVAVKIRQLKKLPENWNSYGSAKIHPLKIQAAIELLYEITDYKTPIPFIFPTSSGGVQIEWHDNDIDIEISVITPNRFNVFYDNPTKEEEWEKEFSIDLKKITDSLLELTT